MRYSPEIEQKIIQQIQAEPDREVILPAWAYGPGETQPFVYVDGKQIRLARLLYQKLIGELPHQAGMKLHAHRDQRNINPYLFVITPTRRTRIACPNGHDYTSEDLTTKGHRCRQCRTRSNTGEPSVADINATKTHCPMDHEYTRENTIRLKSGRRRCKQCHRDAQARYRARQKEIA